MSEPEDFVICRICDKRFQQITHSHLKKEHAMILEEYQSEFPEAPMRSKKYRKKLSAVKAGENNPMYGRIGVGNPNFGKTPSEETKAKISAAHMGKTFTEEHKAKISVAYTLVRRAERSASMMGENNPMNQLENRAKITGENNSNWKGGISFEPYCSAFNERLKEHIRNLCGRICTICGKSTLQNKRRLGVDHLDENKMQGCDNWEWRLTPLCPVCHGRMQNPNSHVLLQLLLVNNKRHQTNFLFGDE